MSICKKGPLFVSETVHLPSWVSCMFYRNHNLKRTIGLLGVVLAMLSGIQQSHALCYLAVCNTHSASVEKADKGTAACPFAHRCNERRTKPSVLPEDAGVNRHSDSCPCPPTCWCHQSPGPLSLPTSACEPVELSPRSLERFHSPMTSLGVCGRSSSADLEAMIGASIESVTLHCAKLCRFLI